MPSTSALQHMRPELDDVLAMLAEGGTVLQQEEDRWAGQHWRSFHFAVAKGEGVRQQA
jgi:hypothetical protein